MVSQPFTEWLAEHTPAAGAGSAGEVVMFPTCYGEYNFPAVPRAAVRVLEKNGFRVIVPEGLSCCGMPNLDGGDVAAATKKARENVELLLPWVDRGLEIVVPGPTCGYTMKKEWPEYLQTAPAAKVAAATRDLMEFCDRLRKEKRLNKEFERGFGVVAYHAACHLRAQKIAYPGARVLSQLPDTEVRIVERCSAVDGTWGMKSAFYEQGRKYALRMVKAIENEEPELVVSDCNLAALRIRKENQRTVLHPVQALALAYGLESAEELGLGSPERHEESERA
jgi:glycerol-3-phosphate dehydrogenase subunit C